MKFVFYTDVQLSGKTPRHRIDDYPQALIDKMAEIYQAAIDENADFLVCGGDIFNSHRIFNYDLLNAIMDIMQDSGLETYITIGQHDILGYNRKTYKSSALAFVVGRHCNLHIIWEPVTIGDVQLIASHVWEDPKEASTYPLDDSKYKVLVAHHLLTNKKTMFDTVNTGDFAKWMREGGAEYNMVLSGDLHDGYDLHEVDGMWFCNPGSIARQAISDIKRLPRYAMIEASPGDIPIIDIRDVKCAKVGEDVFDESVTEIVRQRDDFDPTAFINEVEEFEIESADVHELIQKVGKAKRISKEILEYISIKSEKSS
jgi:DNA repair exonuclease SbcCD nuclease subunit